MKRVSKFAIRSFASAEAYLRSGAALWIDVQQPSGAIYRVSRMPKGRFKLRRVETAELAAQREQAGELVVADTAEQLFDTQQELL